MKLIILQFSQVMNYVIFLTELLSKCKMGTVWRNRATIRPPKQPHSKFEQTCVQLIMTVEHHKLCTWSLWVYKQYVYRVSTRREFLHVQCVHVKEMWTADTQYREIKGSAGRHGLTSSQIYILKVHRSHQQSTKKKRFPRTVLPQPISSTMP